MPIILLAVLVVVLDQAVKYYVASHMTLGMSIPVINNVFHLTYILNPGAAFSLLEHQTGFFVAVAAVMLAAVGYYYPRIPVQFLWLRIGISLLAGGAVGNVIDRIRTGYVVDFFDFRIWPVFNVADIAIVSGVGLIVFHMLYVEREAEQDEDED